MWLGLGGTLALAVVVAAVVTWLGLRALHVREFKPEQQLSAATLYDLLRVAFGPAEGRVRGRAGIGGVVALVTAYRRQRVGEFAQELAARGEDRASGPPGQTARHDKPLVAVTPQAGGRWLRAGNARSPSAGTTPGSSPQATAR
jgi:hypothetical protein